MNQEIILFRFHRSWDICEQTLQILNALNPDTPIHGLYGGDDHLQTIPENVTQYFTSLWAIPLDDTNYKWKNGDLCVRWWFKNLGHRYDFEHVYLTEWDMIFLKPMSEVFPKLQPDCNYASIFGDHTYAKKIDWYWIKQQFGEEVNDLLEHLEAKGTKIEFTELDFAIMGGVIFCRKFLELFAQDPIPSYSNDEVRLSIYSKSFNIPLLNNGLYNDPANRFKADNYDSDVKSALEDLEYVRQHKGNVIHPVRVLINNLKEKILNAQK